MNRSKLILFSATFGGLIIALVMILYLFPNPSPKVDVNTPPSTADYYRFIELASPNFGDQQVALDHIQTTWQPGSEIMLLESLRRVKDEAIRESGYALLSQKTGQAIGEDQRAWFTWIWNQNLPTHPQYAAFKRDFYATIDPRFESYFHNVENAKIQLTEIVWGSVAQDGIPPLNRPGMISAKEAVELDDSNVVFGVVLGGEARCYPKRILAWHEMVKDRIAGVDVCGVY